MKHSIGFKLSISIVVIMSLAIAIAGAFGSAYLGDFYASKKQKSIKNVYEKVRQVSDTDESVTKTENIKRLNSVCEKYGASMIILDSSWDPIYAYGSGKMLVSRGKDIILGNNREQKETPDIIEEGKNYQIQSTEEGDSSRKYYELFATLPSGGTVLIRMSVENFQESIAISNKFYLLVGIVLLVITTMTIILIARRYTRPVLQLAEISKKMSELDFETKYEGNRKDEIGVLGESMNELSEKLEETITDLKKANIELHRDIQKKEEIDEMRKDFISNVSHELKTPIALIQGYAEGLQEGISDNPEDLQYYCDVIVDEAGKMNQMVRQLLNLIQLEQGSNPIQMERFDVVSVIRGVIDSMKIKSEEQGIEIEFLEQKPVYVWADEFQIEQVITNYLSNALHYVDENKEIKVKISSKDGIVRVSVFNSGNQISEEDKENIWVKFYKVDKARTREYGGNGIGLSIVKAIMERHEKNFGVENREGGVEFWFELDAQA
ncbi:MAG: HAMP domain-containing histidine kinase [Eubacterium sp.]|nr:HAMP domain-containing histidine kinase [Eubacterium sp.]